MKFFRNLAGVLVTTAVIAPLGLVSSILLARFLSTDDRGLYAIATTFATLTTMLFQFGWPTASIFRLRSAGTRPAEVTGSVVIFMGGVSTVVALVAFALEPLLQDRLLSGLPTAIFLLMVVTIPFRALANGFGAVARGIDRFRYENWYAFLLQVGNLSALGIALILLEGALFEVMAALAAVYIVLASGLVVRVIRDTGVTLAVRPKEISRSLRFGLKTYAMTATGRVHERVDVFLLAALLAEPTQVAFYAIAKGGIQLLQMLPNALGKVAYPQLAGLEERDAAEFACALVRQGLLFMVPGSIVLFLVAPILLPLVYGAPYAASTQPFLLLLPGVLLLGVDRVISRYFTGTNQHAPNIATRAISLVVNVSLNLLWIPEYGIVGAAAAGLASYIVDAVLIIVVFLRMTDKRVRDLVLIRRSDLDPYFRVLQQLRPS